MPDESEGVGRAGNPLFEPQVRDAILARHQAELARLRELSERALQRLNDTLNRVDGPGAAETAQADQDAAEIAEMIEGIELTDADVQRLVAEAEAGYDPDRMRPRYRPAAPGIEPPEPMTVRAGPCLYCGDELPKTILWRLKATDGALAGQQMKVSAYWWPWMKCEACGHESEGVVTHDEDDPADGVSGVD